MEIGVIVVMAVLLFPAKELPKLARMIARVYGQVRKTAEDFRSAVLDDEDLREPIDQIRGAYNDARWEVRDAERKARQQLAKAQMEMRMATAKRIQAERDTEKAKAAAAAAAGAAVGSGEGEGATDSATPAGPIQIAANGSDDADAGSDDADAEPEEDDARPEDTNDGPEGADDEPTSGPVAGPDPRRIAPRKPPSYTPPVAAEASASDGAAGDEPREGVA